MAIGTAAAVLGSAVIGGIASSSASSKAASASRSAANTQAQSGREAMAEQRRASEAAMAYQREAAAQGQGYLDPYQAIGQRGLDQMGFLDDSQAQFDWLQGNPLFQMGLDNANRTTQASSAARGRLSAGDTLMQLNNNALLTAQPLINGRKQDIWSQLGMGQNLAATQANTALGVGTNLSNIQTGLGNNVSNLMTGIGNVNAAGQIGAANARNQGIGNMAGLMQTAIGGFNQPDWGGAYSDVGNMLDDPGLF